MAIRIQTTDSTGSFKSDGKRIHRPSPQSPNGKPVADSSSIPKLNWTINIPPDVKNVLYLSDLTLLALLQQGDSKGLTKEDIINKMFYDVYQNKDVPRRSRRPSFDFISFLEKRLDCLAKNGFIEPRDNHYYASDLAKTRDDLTPAQDAIFTVLREAGADGADIPELIKLFNPNYSFRPSQDSSLYYEVVLNNLWVLRARGLVTSETLVGSGGVYKIKNS